MKIFLLISRILSVFCILLLSGISSSYAGAARAQGNDQQLVVVELFTSQGCNLCPPADDILAEFSKQENILALSYSVDYWNYLGWEDTLAKPECTLRQKKYNIALGKNGVYTPQMIIQGDHDVIGSRQDLITKMIEDARQSAGDYHLTGLDITFNLTGDMIDLRISAPDAKRQATIWIIGYDFEKTVTIKRGELGGQIRKYHNVVQAIKRIGSWTGEDIKLTLSKQDIGDENYDSYALLLQAHETGPIIAAAKLKK